MHKEKFPNARMQTRRLDLFRWRRSTMLAVVAAMAVARAGSCRPRDGAVQSTAETG